MAQANENRPTPPDNRTTPSRREVARLRLAIAIPALMVLLPMILGIIHYRFLEETLGGIAPENPAYGQLAVALLRIYVSTFVIAALSLLFGLGISLTISKPIRQLIRTTREIATGDLSQTVPADTGDEFGALGNSFNEMIASLNRIITERNRYILECYTGGLIITDRNGRIMAANSAAEQLLGEPVQRLVSRPIDEILSRHEDTEQLREIVGLAIKEGQFFSSKEVTIRLRGGQDFPLVVTTSPLRDVGRDRAGVVINFRDLSEIKAFYRKITRADRLAAVGTLAAGVAHEIRNPLGSIKGLAEMLRHDSAEGSQVRRYADVIVREVKRLDQVVRELLEFARSGDQETRLWNLNKILSEALEAARWQVGARKTDTIKVRQNFGEIPALAVSADRIRRAFINIIVNAFEACQAGGEVIVTSKYQPDGKSSGIAVVTIENTGEPIAPENIERIFEPFFSTKPSGTGLGLPIAYQIITSHGGMIDVESHDNRTVFSVKLPARAGPLRTGPPKG